MADISILYRARSEGYNLLISANPCSNAKHILASMIYFDSDMSKSTNTVVYFDWKTGVNLYLRLRKMSLTIYAANGKVSHIHGACANEIIPNG